MSGMVNSESKDLLSCYSSAITGLCEHGMKVFMFCITVNKAKEKEVVLKDEGVKGDHNIMWTQCSVFIIQGNVES